MIKDISKQNVLVAPLDWGLGHATRMIPLIQQLKEQSNHVIIASSALALEFLKERFPDLSFISLPAYNISYSSRSVFRRLIFQLPRAFHTLRSENKLLQSIITEHSVDIIVSDNRFGCYSNLCKSVFITHQRHIVLPKILRFVEPIADRVNARFINKFDELWIPDSNEFQLSKPFEGNKFISIHQKYIGILSRFTPTKRVGENKYDYACILSGPEPQRAILEQKLITVFKNSEYKTAIVTGCYNSIGDYNNIFVFGRLHEKELLKVINSSKYLIFRSGYSSVMDLIALDRKAILIPTPGQSEQEELAMYLKQKFDFEFIEQNKIDLETIKQKTKELNI